ncbi:MAG TPA: GAF domain-containing protein [Casimicrobiaceae bacterium]|nr:GAF domain-containing protein [Casimicrobiaceae bacterium]
MATLLEPRPLTAADMQAILAVTRALAAPFDLATMLGEVINAAKQVLHADRASVWLYDSATDELVLEVATGIKPVRIPAGAGLAGSCARNRRIMNVPDCYADPRFDSSVDKRSGYRTRCMLTLPLIDHKDTLVGVMQVLNKAGGSFDRDDEAVAAALAAQCAVALQRVRMTAALIVGEKMRQELETARTARELASRTVVLAAAGVDRCSRARRAPGRRHDAGGGQARREVTARSADIQQGGRPMTSCIAAKVAEICDGRAATVRAVRRLRRLCASLRGCRPTPWQVVFGTGH